MFSLNMAASGIRERSRSARTFSRNRSDNEEDNVHLDANKDATENAYEILSNICKKQGVSDIRRSAMLNLFVKLMEDVKNAHLPFAFSKKEIFCCLRVGLVSANTTVRASAHRVFRHCIDDSSDVLILNKLQIPHLIARSVDLVLKNEHERIQALRLALKMLNLSPRNFSTAVTRSLVSLVNGASDSKDRMMYSALYLLCQLCVLNADTAIECAGEACLLRCCIETAQGKINECLVGCLLFLLNKPDTRNRAQVCMDYLTSVYCDLQRKKNSETNIFTSSRLSILAAIRTWPGVFYLCNPENSSAMKAVISVMYFKDEELRKAILDLLCDIFGVDGLDWPKEVDIAMMNIDPYQARDSWRLSEKFVAGEGKDILPHRACTRPNLTETHTALLLYSFLECGVLAALVEVAVTSDSFLSTQAIVLLGYLLYLFHKLLPSDLMDVSPSLPSLVNFITEKEPRNRVRAIMIMSALKAIHNMLTRPLAPASLFLRHHLVQGPLYKKKKPGGVKKAAFGASGDVDSGGKILLKNLEMHIKEAEISSHQDPRDWIWSEIATIVKCRNESFMRLDDLQHRIILRKLVHFYKPTSSQFSVIEYSFREPQTSIYTSTALDFIDLLLDFPPDSEGQKMLENLVEDIMNEVNRLIGTESPHDCLLSPSRVATTLSQHYFLMLGHLTRTPRGLAVLEKSKALRTLHFLVKSTTHDVFIKLIVSSLCYSLSTMARKILSEALTSSIDSVRVYATELLLVLARCQVPKFHEWGLDLLIPQIYDKNKLVATTSIEILHELSYDSVILDSLIATRPSLLHLGDKGQLLLIRFLSTPSGFSFLNESKFIEKEMDNWERGYNYRYVGLVESAVHDALTLHQREDNGKYSRRLTNARHRWKPVWVPPHLYGQLAAHPAGMCLLESNPCVQRMIQKVLLASCDTDEEILELKASMWALANIGTSTLGLSFVDERHVVHQIVTIAQTCAVLSLRATAFYCLSLIATTEQGASILSQMDWLALRRCRTEVWPLEVLPGERSSRNYDDGSSLEFSVAETDSVEDLAPFLEPPLTTPHLLSMSQRASTLPPGLSGGMDEVDLSKSPPKSGKARHQRSYSETCSFVPRQQALQSTTPQRLSMEDAAGLATLQTLQAPLRPDLSINNIYVQQTRRFNEQRSSSPMHDFEAENPRLFFDPTSFNESDMHTPPRTPTPSSPGPVYCGICLPRSLSRIFTMTERREERRRKRGSASFSEMEKVKEEEKPESSSSSESSDPEDKSLAASKSRHNGVHCLACCTKVPPKRQRKSSSGFRRRTDTESSYGNAPEGSPISLKWRLKVPSEVGSGESFSCGEGELELSSAFIPPVISLTRVRRDVIKHVGRMCNPVWAKASRLSLLRLRQSHQTVFQDVCLYSEICGILSSSSCRVSARRFIQELFLEMTFSQFYEDAETILAQYAPSPPPGTPPAISAIRNEPLSPQSKSSCLSSPTKNLSTVFENLSSCGTQSLQGGKISSKDCVPKT